MTNELNFPYTKAFSPLFGIEVEIKRYHFDSDNNMILVCENKEANLENHLFRFIELTNFKVE
jgi:hypothetical protein